MRKDYRCCRRPGPRRAGRGPAVLGSEDQRLFGLAELVADYGRKQGEGLEPVLRC